MRIDRRPRTGPDRFLWVRVGAFFLAAAIFGAGVLTGLDWLVPVAAAVAVGGWLLRFADRSRRERLERHPDWGGDEPGPPR